MTPLQVFKLLAFITANPSLLLYLKLPTRLAGPGKVKLPPVIPPPPPMHPPSSFPVAALLIPAAAVLGASAQPALQP